MQRQGLRLVMASYRGPGKRIHEGVGDAGPSRKSGHWSMGLKASMEDPELLVESDERIVIIKDKYPKARHHFLVLPRENIPNLKALKPLHIPLLQHMEDRGKAIAERCSQVLDFRYGYHSIPSMSQVHMHVISQDFDSSCLKTKKHWNSFTTDYFIDSRDVIDMLEEGPVKVDQTRHSAFLKSDLRCHVCGQNQKNMPALKMHIIKHIPKEVK